MNDISDGRVCDVVPVNEPNWAWIDSIQEANRYGVQDIRRLYTDWERPGDPETIIRSRIFWVLGQYSRFVRPGAVRVAATFGEGAAGVGSTDSDESNRRSGADSVDRTDEAGSLASSREEPSGLLVSAYDHDEAAGGGGRRIVVVVNTRAVARTVRIDEGRAYSGCRTSDQANETIAPVEQIGPGAEIAIPPRSATTRVSRADQ